MVACDQEIDPKNTLVDVLVNGVNNSRAMVHMYHNAAFEITRNEIELEEVVDHVERLARNELDPAIKSIVVIFFTTRCCETWPYGLTRLSIRRYHGENMVKN